MIPYLPHSGRRPHVRTFLAEGGFRQRLIDHGWSLRGGYAAKSFRGREYMMTTRTKRGEFIECVIRPKDDFWSEATTQYRDTQARENRAAIHLVKPPEPEPPKPEPPAADPSQYIRDEGYVTVADLLERGWTRRLIEQHLGREDTRFPVNHWANWSGKKAWRLEWVELTESTTGFEAAFLRGARRRRLSRQTVDAVLDRIRTLRETLPLRQERIEDPRKQWERACLARAAELINEARRRGYRTPHKC